MLGRVTVGQSYCSAQISGRRRSAALPEKTINEYSFNELAGIQGLTPFPLQSLWKIFRKACRDQILLTIPQKQPNLYLTRNLDFYS
jgi:hypothetical protein